ncbi:MAG: hypothetical protein A2V64_07545 [Bacteroidetes bacterium RBG_13_43_22]|nr:MAG: hypothetical protein A2V64_07545 [Bacteroidetes bacterium RBG_13_43_22]
MLMVLCTSVISAQSASEKKDPVGKWKFDAPYAPEGYTSGAIDFRFDEGKYKASISLTNMDYTLTGEKVKIQNDSISFFIWIETDSVSVNLKMNDNKTMTGNAAFSEGIIPLTLTKEPGEKQE